MRDYLARRHLRWTGGIVFAAFVALGFAYLSRSPVVWALLPASAFVGWVFQMAWGIREQRQKMLLREKGVLRDGVKWWQMAVLMAALWGGPRILAPLGDAIYCGFIANLGAMLTSASIISLREEVRFDRSRRSG